MIIVILAVLPFAARVAAAEVRRRVGAAAAPAQKKTPDRVTVGRCISSQPLVSVSTSFFARCAHLAADLAAGIERRRVHVHVRKTSANGGDDLGKFAGRNLLA